MHSHGNRGNEVKAAPRQKPRFCTAQCPIQNRWSCPTLGGGTPPLPIDRLPYRPFGRPSQYGFAPRTGCATCRFQTFPLEGHPPGRRRWTTRLVDGLVVRHVARPLVVANHFKNQGRVRRILWNRTHAKAEGHGIPFDSSLPDGRRRYATCLPIRRKSRSLGRRLWRLPTPADRGRSHGARQSTRILGAPPPPLRTNRRP